MSASELWNAPTIVPILAYQDVVAATGVARACFRFPGALRGTAVLGRGRAGLDGGRRGLVCLSTSGGNGVHSPEADGRTHQALKVYVEDLDGHFGRAKAAGAEIVSEPRDGFWGGRIYRVRDLEGHFWEFSQADRDLPASAWKLPPGVRRGQ